MTLFKWLRMILIGLWCLVLLLLGCWLVIDNPTNIAPILVGFTMPQLSLGFYLCLSILLGVVLGFTSAYLVTQARLFRKKRELKRAQREMQVLQRSQGEG